MEQSDLDEVMASGERLPEGMAQDDLLSEDAVGGSVVFDGEKLVVQGEE